MDRQKASRFPGLLALQGLVYGGLDGAGGFGNREDSLRLIPIL